MLMTTFSQPSDRESPSSLDCLTNSAPSMYSLELGNDRVDIYYRVANPSIWMYYLPDPSTNRVLFVTCKNLVTACVPGLLGAIGIRQPHKPI